MIIAKLFFEKKIESSILVNSLKKLPEQLSPVYFAKDEGRPKKSNLLSDEELFLKFRANNRLGFLLYGNDGVSFDVSTSQVSYSEVTMFLDDNSKFEGALEFFRCFLDCKPIFGFACNFDEYIHRNKYFIKIDVNNIETWVGRNLDKYISGLYWCTFLSKDVLNAHDINLAALVEETLSVNALDESSFFVLKFYEAPDGWEINKGRLDGICDKTKGIFSKLTLVTALSGQTNTYLEYSKCIANWK